MSFIEVQFPTDLTVDTRGGPMFSTDTVIFGTSGREYRNQIWTRPRYRYDVVYNVKTRAEAVIIYDLFLAARGRLSGFRLKDFWDFSSASNGRADPTATDQSIGTGDGSTVDYQLIKTYTTGAQSTVRNITKPVSGTVLIALDGTPTTAFTIDTTTGVVTMDTAPSNGAAITAGYNFDVPARFDTDDLAQIKLIVHDDTRDLVQMGTIPMLEVRV